MNEGIAFVSSFGDDGQDALVSESAFGDGVGEGVDAGTGMNL